MKRVILEYQVCSEGMPLEPLLGMPLVQRAVLTLQKAGSQQVDIRVHAADLSAVSTLLEADPRVTIECTCSASATETGESGVLRGDVVFLSSALDSLLADPSLQTSARAGWQALSSDGDRRGREDLLMASLVKDADGIISRNINR